MKDNNKEEDRNKKNTRFRKRKHNGRCESKHISHEIYKHTDHECE